MLNLTSRMSRKRKNQRIKCAHFSWILRQRDGGWQADGRGNKPSPGRHSLGTVEYHQALENLNKLDLLRAVDLGIADSGLLHPSTKELLSIEEGVRLYREFILRPRVAGGVKPTSFKRYRTVHEKFSQFLKTQGINYWNHVTKKQLLAYGSWLDGESYAYRTEFLELTTIKQTVNFFIREGHLPAECQIQLQLRKPSGTDTYCYRVQEVAAMVKLCAAARALHWMHDVIVALACTGVRISELASLRVSDVDLARNVVTLKDETSSRRAGDDPRTTKGSRDRTFPIHPELRPVLEANCRAVGRGPLFRGPNDGSLRPDQVRICLKRDVLKPLLEQFPSEDCEIGFKDGRLHSFRHFFCSMCADKGVPEQMVMKWLGHRSSDMVKHYYHLHDDDAQRRMHGLDFFGKSGSAGASD